MPDFEEMGKAFIGFYYPTFSNDRASLGNVYTDQSCLTFEGAQFQGKGPIVEKLMSLPFKTVNHQITTIDCQPIIGVDDNQVRSCTGFEMVIFPNLNWPIKIEQNR